MSPRRVTVVGGTGFIGRHVSRWLADAGADVTTIQRGRSPAVSATRALTADRADPIALADALAAAEPSVVVDMIAYTAADAKRLLDALPPSVEHLVLAGSGDVYWTYEGFLGFPTSHRVAGPLTESAPLRDRRHPYRAQATSPDDLLYDYDKIDVEEVVRAGTVPVTTLRLPMVYGAGDPQRRIAGYVDRLRAAGDRLVVNAAEAVWRCTRGYVEDVAWAIRLAALADRPHGVLNLGEPDALSEIEWIRAVAATAGWPGEVVKYLGAPPSLPGRWEFPLVVDTSRVRSALGFTEPVGREEGLRRSMREWTP